MLPSASVPVVSARTWVVLIRGINVGGRKLAMTELRDAAQACGLTRCRTYIQSGNLVGETVGDRDPDDLVDALGDQIAARVAFTPAVVVRTADEIGDVILRNPFLPGADDKSLHVVFFNRPAPEPADIDRFAPEQMISDGREIYLYLPFGMGRSPMMQAIGRRKEIAGGTARNWRTVLTLADMTTTATDPHA